MWFERCNLAVYHQSLVRSKPKEKSRRIFEKRRRVAVRGARSRHVTKLPACYAAQRLLPFPFTFPSTTMILRQRVAFLFLSLFGLLALSVLAADRPTQ